MIFFAVVAATLMMMMGIAVEGGRLMVEYRHMQAAADMAALVGAEDLPYQTSQAVTDACAYMANNGYDNCSTSSTSASTTTVCVPPSSLTPYNFIQYNPASTPCSTTATTSKYIEVQVSEPLRVPIFNISFSMYTHAIARNGAYQPRDYAIAVLDPHECRALSMSGSNSLLAVGPVISNSDATTGQNCSNTTPNSIYAQGGNTGTYDVACDGDWETAADEAYSTSSNIDGQLRTLKAVESNGQMTTGVPSYSPIGCWNAPPYDTTTDFNALTAPISDPYGGSCPPAASSTSGCQSSLSGVFPKCKACQDSPANYYVWTGTARWSGTWKTASSGVTISGCCYELFPGEYKGGITFQNGGVAYLNPGVYTVDSGISVNGGNGGAPTMCVFGAPACDVLNGYGTNQLGGSQCASYAFTSASPPDPTNTSYQTNANRWYYYCSPFGTWDTDTCLGSGSKTCTTSVRPADTLTAPTFSDGVTPLNGVTFYMVNGTSNNGGFQGTGGNFDVAAPDPCPGNSTGTTGSVTFNSGTVPPLSSGWSSTTSGYTYPTGSSDPQTLSGVSTASARQVYPDVDLSIKEDSVCDTYFGGTQPTMWQNEFANNAGQHLHFIFFSRDGNSPISLEGNGGQYWRGIVYNPTAYSGNGQNSGNSYIVNLSGTSGGGTGPPLLTGQVIADDFQMNGNATVEVFFRPCTPTQQCSSAPKIQLVE
jgi:Flp pilus assembly protein TadG